MPVEEPFNELDSESANVVEILGGRPRTPAKKAISEPKETEYCAQCEIMGTCPEHDRERK